MKIEFCEKVTNIIGLRKKKPSGVCTTWTPESNEGPQALSLEIALTISG